MNRREHERDDEPALPREPGAPESPERRRLLARVSVGLGACCGGVVVPMVGFVLSPLLQAVPRVWRSVGKTSDFRVGETVNVTFLDASPLPWAGVTAHMAAWLRREGPDQFVAFSVDCAHLGCPVRWLPKANLFMCPCHGGVYYANGDVAAGPPPHGLWRYPVRVQDGDVQVRADPLPLG